MRSISLSVDADNYVVNVKQRSETASDQSEGSSTFHKAKTANRKADKIDDLVVMDEGMNLGYM